MTKKARLLKLRKKAKEQLSAITPQRIRSLSSLEISKILFDLETYRIELELQNEELTNTQDELHSSHKKYIKLYDYAPVGYLTISYKGIISKTNLTLVTMLEKPKSLLLKTHLSLHIIEEDRDILYLNLEKAKETGKKQRCELRMLKSDKDIFWGHLEILPTIVDKNQNNEFGITISNITERKQAEAELKDYSENLEAMVSERTQKLEDAQEQLIRKEKLAGLGQLAGGVGHELRNPLGTISNAVYYLSTVDKIDDTARAQLDIITSEINTSTRIISELLDFGRVTTASKKNVDLNVLVNKIMAKHPLSKNVALSLLVDSKMAPLYVDPLQLEQVLTNLVSNACQAMDNKGGLTVQAKRVKTSIVIKVTDTGKGIAKENMDKVFEPLFTTRAKGIGLGLAISKNLVEVNGGSISVKSTEGKGATFTIKLPIKT